MIISCRSISLGTSCIQNIDGSKLEHIVWNKYFNKEKLKICALHLQRGNDVQGSVLLYIKPYLNGHYPVFIAVLYRNSKFPFSSCNNLIDFIHSLYLLHPFSYYYKKQFCFLLFMRNDHDITNVYFQMFAIKQNF